MTDPGQEPEGLHPTPDLRARLATGDIVITCRKLASVYRTPPLSTVRTLLRLGRVDRLDELGAAGPLHAATTVATPWTQIPSCASSR
jgi:hypothetical protein